jgi:hypothetical protein
MSRVKRSKPCRLFSVSIFVTVALSSLIFCKQAKATSSGDLEVQNTFFSKHLGTWVDAGEVNYMTALVREKKNWHLYFNEGYGILCVPCYTWPNNPIDSFPDNRQFADSAFSQWGRAYFSGYSTAPSHVFIRTGEHTLEHRIYSRDSAFNWTSVRKTVTLNLPAYQRILALGPIESLTITTANILKMEIYGIGGNIASVQIDKDSLSILYSKSNQDSLAICYVGEGFWGSAKGQLYRYGRKDTILIQLEAPIHFVGGSANVVTAADGSLGFSYGHVWLKDSRKFPHFGMARVGNSRYKVQLFGLTTLGVSTNDSLASTPTEISVHALGSPVTIPDDGANPFQITPNTVFTFHLYDPDGYAEAPDIEMHTRFQSPRQVSTEWTYASFYYGCGDSNASEKLFCLHLPLVASDSGAFRIERVSADSIRLSASIDTGSWKLCCITLYPGGYYNFNGVTLPWSQTLPLSSTNADTLIIKVGETVWRGVNPIVTTITGSLRSRNFHSITARRKLAHRNVLGRQLLPTRLKP